MAGNELIIDDDYCRAMGRYFISQGEQMDKLCADYIAILQDIKNNAIISGEVSEALRVYVQYAEKLNKQIGSISVTIEKQIQKFLSKIDDADQYLF